MVLHYRDRGTAYVYVVLVLDVLDDLDDGARVLGDVNHLGAHLGTTVSHAPLH